MSEAEKQDSQKTVVAFITGLLVGGLLVWVFSSSPEKAPVSNETETNTEDTASTNDGDSLDTEVDSEVSITPSDETAVATDKGGINVLDQKGGTAVEVKSVAYPSVNGWIVVRDYENNLLGGILGAARYNTTEGLTPTSVELLRPTIAGKTYKVVFYTESGDKKFSTPEDTMIEGIGDTFSAQ